MHQEKGASEPAPEEKITNTPQVTAQGSAIAEGPALDDLPAYYEQELVEEAEAGSPGLKVQQPSLDRSAARGTSNPLAGIGNYPEDVFQYITADVLQLTSEQIIERYLKEPLSYHARIVALRALLDRSDTTAVKYFVGLLLSRIENGMVDEYGRVFDTHTKLYADKKDIIAMLWDDSLDMNTLTESQRNLYSKLELDISIRQLLLGQRQTKFSLHQAIHEFFVSHSMTTCDETRFSSPLLRQFFVILAYASIKGQCTSKDEVAALMKDEAFLKLVLMMSLNEDYSAALELCDIVMALGLDAFVIFLKTQSTGHCKRKLQDIALSSLSINVGKLGTVDNVRESCTEDVKIAQRRNINVDLQESATYIAMAVMKGLAPKNEIEEQCKAILELPHCLSLLSAQHVERFWPLIFSLLKELSFREVDIADDMALVLPGIVAQLVTKQPEMLDSLIYEFMSNDFAAKTEPAYVPALFKKLPEELFEKIWFACDDDFLKQIFYQGTRTNGDQLKLLLDMIKCMPYKVQCACWPKLEEILWKALFDSNNSKEIAYFFPLIYAELPEDYLLEIWPSLLDKLHDAISGATLPKDDPLIWLFPGILALVPQSVLTPPCEKVVSIEAILASRLNKETNWASGALIQCAQLLSSVLKHHNKLNAVGVWSEIYEVMPHNLDHYTYDTIEAEWLVLPALLTCLSYELQQSMLLKLQVIAIEFFPRESIKDNPNSEPLSLSIEEMLLSVLKQLKHRAFDGLLNDIYDELNARLMCGRYKPPLALDKLYCINQKNDLAATKIAASWKGYVTRKETVSMLAASRSKKFQLDPGSVESGSTSSKTLDGQASDNKKQITFGGKKG